MKDGQRIGSFQEVNIKILTSKYMYMDSFSQVFMIRHPQKHFMFLFFDKLLKCFSLLILVFDLHKKSSNN